MDQGNPICESEQSEPICGHVSEIYQTLEKNSHSYSHWIVRDLLNSSSAKMLDLEALSYTCVRYHRNLGIKEAATYLMINISIANQKLFAYRH